MQSINNIDNFKKGNEKTVVTIGTFDGVHIGHQMVLKKVIASAIELNYKSIVLTFFPHPRMILQQDTSIKLLNTIKEKEDLLEKAGLDYLVIHPFDKIFSKLTAEEFVTEILVKKLNVGKIIIGYDHRFGRNRAADINDLIEFGKQYGFEVEQISAKEIDEISISSTKIREALNNGDVLLANEYLDYTYFLEGTVVFGNQIGRTINYPTANLKISEDYKLIPQNGVYIVSCKIENKVYFGMMNIGTNPTFLGTEKKIEIHFFDFNSNIYGLYISVNIHLRIRNEEKFNSINELKQQLELDEKYTKKYINKNLC